MPNKQLKRGMSALPSKFKKRNSSMCDQSCSHLLRNATTTRQIRPAPQRFGQRSTRLHLVLSVCIRQDSGGANKHEVRAGPVLFYGFQRDDVENQKRSYFCTRNFSFQGLSVSAFLLTSK